MRWSLRMTDAADGITGRISHVIMMGALLMALFMSEDTITLCRAAPLPAAVIFKRTKSDFYIQICMLMYLSNLEKKNEDE